MIIARPFQDKAVKLAVPALVEFRNTLVQAPTGAGKSFIGAMIAQEYIKNNKKTGKILWLQHDENLVYQNKDAFITVTGNENVGIVQGPNRDWDSDNIFGTYQTVINDIDIMPVDFDLIVVDEGHRIAAPSYITIINHIKKNNPDSVLLCITATPERADKKSLMQAGINNMSFTISELELIQMGFLVKPVFKGQDVGIIDDLRSINTNMYSDQPEVQALMNRELVVDGVIKSWESEASNRKTVFFMPGIESVDLYTQKLNEAGYKTVGVHSKMPKKQVKENLEAYKNGEVQNIVNAMMLIEGWDDQPTSCVAINRNCGHKSALKQIIGRGLRVQDPKKYPGLPIKKDCLVLDYGANLEKHEDLFDPVKLQSPKKKGVAPTKSCKSCGFLVPLGAKECPNCGSLFPVSIKTKDVVIDVVLVEKDILKNSPFRWYDYTSKVSISNSFSAWCILYKNNQDWYAIGGKNKEIEHLMSGSREMCLAVADDFLRRNGDIEGSRKSKSWLRKAPTDKQIELLNNLSHVKIPNIQLNRYQASCLITLGFNSSKLKTLLKKVIKNEQ